MKYIKKYEVIITNNDEMPKNSKFKIGDFVVIISPGLLQNKVFNIVAYDYEKNFKMYSIRSLDINISRNNPDLYWPTKDLRLATEDEIEQYLIDIKVNKYNL